MSDAFSRALDDMIAQAEKPELPSTLPAPPQQDVAPEAPVDPFAHLIGRSDPDADRDPFAAMLDGMLAAEGMDKGQEVEKVPEPELHAWETDRETLYENDDYQVTCKKCFRSMRVTREETLGQAMQRHTIARDCSVQITAEVMSE